MSKTKIHIPLRRTVALRVVYAFMAIVSFLIWVVGFPMGIPIAAGGVLLINIAFILLIKSKIGAFKREYYVSLDEEGISWSLNIITNPVSLYWKDINQINEHLYEINFRHNKTGLTYNLQTNYIPKKHLKAFTSVLEENRKLNGL